MKGKEKWIVPSPVGRCSSRTAQQLCWGLSQATGGPPHLYSRPLVGSAKGISVLKVDGWADSRAVHVCAQTHTHMSLHTDTEMYTYTHPCLYTHTHAYIYHIHSYVCAHSYPYMYTHACTHTYRHVHTPHHLTLHTPVGTDTHLYTCVHVLHACTVCINVYIHSCTCTQ